MTDFPAITIGSYKQIAWATEIRANVFAAIEAARSAKGITWTQAQADALAKLAAVDIAAYWIDARDKGEVAVTYWLGQAQYLAQGGKLSY